MKTIDKPYLEQMKAEALKQVETFKANLHAAMGYIQAIDAMLARLDAPEAEVKEEAKDA